jgi:O-antigen/teichoic acid export membrane protein
MLAQAEPDDREAQKLLTIACLASILWGALISAGCGVAIIFFGANRWLIAAGPLVSVASLQTIGLAAYLRARRYRSTALANFVHGAGAGVVQVLLGWWFASVGSLIAGFAASRVIWVRAIHWQRVSPRELVRTWTTARRFAFLSGGSAAINSLGGQLPILLCAWLYGQAEVGMLAMAIRILVAPLGIIGQAAASATTGEVGRLLRNREGAADLLVRRGMRDLFLLGLLPCLSAAALGPWLVPIVLGTAWAPAGTLVAWLSAGTLAQFTAAPFSQLLNIAGRSRLMLGWDVTRIVVIAGAFGLAALTGGTVIVAVALYTFAQIFLYVLLGRWCLETVRTYR